MNRLAPRVDDLGREVSVPGARRIVSLVPSISELLCDLGVGERLIGVTRFCTHPPEVVEKCTKVGGTKDPDRETIAKLAPDLVFVDHNENRLEDFQWLAERFNVFVTNPHTVDDVVGTIRRIGAIVDCGTKADEIGHSIARAVESHVVQRDAMVRVFCPIWRNPWMTFNGSTYASDLLQACGAINVCKDLDSMYPRVTLRDVAAYDPEVVFLPDEPYVFGEKHIALMGEMSGTSAWKKQRIYPIDGKAMFWFGARTVEAIPLIRKQLRRGES